MEMLRIMKKFAGFFYFMNSIKIKNDKIMKEKDIKILKEKSILLYDERDFEFLPNSTHY